MMKKLSFSTAALLCLFLSFHAFASDRNIPDSRSSEKVKIWKSCARSVGDSQAELLLFPAPKDNNSGVSVIVCPGGSYYWLDKHNEGTKVATWLNANGISAYVLYYRRALRGHHFPKMTQDIERAMELVRFGDPDIGDPLSSLCGADPDKVGVMGFSAGGHLVGTLGTWWNWDLISSKTGVSLDSLPEDALKPAFTAMIYPVVSMEDGVAHEKSRNNLLRRERGELMHRLSLEKNVHSDMPPVFLVCCKDDPTVDCRNSEIYSEALSRSGVKHSFMEYEHSGHGFGVSTMGGANDWAAQFLRWVSALFN